MASTDAPLNDLAAIFHCSFHPTKGNHIDWSRKSTETLDLDGVEFNALPSGLHVLDEDVIHFTKESYHGVCLFQRSESKQIGMRGYNQRSIGILVAQTPRPRPWRHLESLKELSRSLPAAPDSFSLLDSYFEKHQSSKDAKEEDGVVEWAEEYPNDVVLNHPEVEIRQLLASFGPFLFTLYKHILGGRRVLFYTLPPVQPACILAQALADFCQVPQKPPSSGISTLGVVTLNDIDRLKHWKKGGWVACSTDKIFFDKPELYDLIVDLSTKNERPILMSSKRSPRSSTVNKLAGRSGLRHTKFTWSDVASWDEMTFGGTAGADVTTTDFKSHWSNPWTMYDDACILFSRYLLGNTRKSAHSPIQLNNKSFRDSLLHPFQRRTSFLLTTLFDVTSTCQTPDSSTMSFPPQVLSAFELGPLSASDAIFIEWLGECNGRSLEITRTWRDLFCLAIRTN